MWVQARQRAGLGTSGVEYVGLGAGARFVAFSLAQSLLLP